MYDFTQEELIEAMDRVAWELLERHHCEEPPIDIQTIAEEEFDLRVVEVEPDPEASRSAAAGRPSRRGRPGEILVSLDQSEESRAWLIARTCAKLCLPRVLHRLRAEVPTQPRQANPLVQWLAPRLLVPTRWLRRDLRRAHMDLYDWKALYMNVPYEVLGLRWLDLEDDPCVMTLVDYDSVLWRRSRYYPVDRQLLPSEASCRAKIQQSESPVRQRQGDWTTWGWPLPDGPFGRILLRSIHDEI